MASNWKEATCEKCTFQVDGYCRRSPVRIAVVNHELNLQKMIMEKEYNPACAEYQEEGILPRYEDGLIVNS
jgi:hypothetical protein